jgi:hypothetical protein
MPRPITGSEAISHHTMGSMPFYQFRQTQAIFISGLYLNFPRWFVFESGSATQARKTRQYGSDGQE